MGYGNTHIDTDSIVTGAIQKRQLILTRHFVLIRNFADELNGPKMTDQCQVMLDVKLDLKERKQEFWQLRVSIVFVCLQVHQCCGQFCVYYFSPSLSISLLFRIG